MKRSIHSSDLTNGCGFRKFGRRGDWCHWK